MLVPKLHLGTRLASPHMTDILAIAGPTASGKSALAVACAERLDTEIISADSMQVYRGMEIGTAAPTPEERARVPHHLVGCLEPGAPWSAGIFEAQAAPIVRRLNAAGKVAVVAGGSGLYVHALLDGMFDGPAGNAAVRERLHAEAASGEDLFARLESVDPTYASVIDRNDLRRVVRGLEVFEVSGRTLSDWHAEHRAQRPPFNALQFAIDWPRETLYARVEQRVDAMMEAGFVEEVRRLIDDGYEAALRQLRAVGYGPILNHLAGTIGLDEAVDLVKRDTRRFAKRQLTWFRADGRVEWLTPPDEAGACAVADYVVGRVSAGSGSRQV